MTSDLYPNPSGVPARRARWNRPDRFGPSRHGTDRLVPDGCAVILGRDCLVHPDHDESVPIEQHFIRPRTRGGDAGQVVVLCANAHGRIHHFLDEIEAYAVACPYATVEEVLARLPLHVSSGYDETEKAVAFRGWETYGLGFLNGRYNNAYRRWRTDGCSKQDDVPHFRDLFHASRWSRRWRREMNDL